MGVSKTEILSYVMETPGNTNRQILSYMLDDFGGGAKEKEYVVIAEETYTPESVEGTDGIYGYDFLVDFIPTSDSLKVTYDGKEYMLPRCQVSATEQNLLTAEVIESRSQSDESYTTAFLNYNEIIDQSVIYVTFDGIDYTCPKNTFSDSSAFNYGATSLAELSDTMPFLITNYNGNNMIFIHESSSNEHTISIYVDDPNTAIVYGEIDSLTGIPTFENYPIFVSFYNETGNVFSADNDSHNIIIEIPKEDVPEPTPTPSADVLPLPAYIILNQQDSYIPATYTTLLEGSSWETAAEAYQWIENHSSIDNGEQYFLNGAVVFLNESQSEYDGGLQAAGRKLYGSWVWYTAWGSTIRLNENSLTTDSGGNEQV